MLSGATGQLYGNKYTWPFLEEWQAHLNTVGSRQMTYVTNLFAQHRWFDLVPDDDHSVVVSGYGLYSGYGRAFAGTRPYRPPRRGQDTNYVTAARTPDGRLVMAYVPEGQTIGVDMSKLATGVRARLYDPTRGTYRRVAGSPFDNAGTREFSPPGKNGDGDTDWVLVLAA
jgi:Putative collagen-binding domain of a collagenase